jgi:P2-related tail formation protein
MDYNVNGSTAHCSRQAFTLGQTDVPGSRHTFRRTVVTSVANAANYAQLVQLIEDVSTFANQQITVSFWAKADASKPISVQMGQKFGSGGSPSTDVYFGVTKTTIGTSGKRLR